MASNSIPQISWCLFVFSFLITASLLSAQPNILSLCSNSNFTTNSTYQSNLNRVLSTLPSAGWRTGFSFITRGQAPNQVFGRSLCLGYIDPSECQSCLLNGLEAIKTICPQRKRVGLWYGESCLLRYSDTNLTTSDEKKWLQQTLYDGDDMPNPVKFEGFYTKLMGSLADRAANSTQMFKVDEANYTSGITVYGLVQCIRDLSPDECYTCLQQYISSFQPTSFYWGKQGFALLGFECYIRTDVTPYFNLSLIDTTHPAVSPPLVPPFLQPEPKKGTSIMVHTLILCQKKHHFSEAKFIYIGRKCQGPKFLIYFLTPRNSQKQLKGVLPVQ